MKERSLPTLAHMRTVLRIGMTRDDFFRTCDDLMDRFTLQVGSPALDPNIVTISVEEGGKLMCFLHEAALSYVEYEGDVFLE
jgi:hypothetical protein